MHAASQKKNSAAASSAPAPFLNAGMKASSMAKSIAVGGTSGNSANTSTFFNNRSRPPLVKLLGSALRLYTDFARHAVHGINGSFQMFSISPELSAAFAELEQQSKPPISAAGQAGPPPTLSIPVGPGLHPPTSSTLDAKVFEALSAPGSVFAAPLREPFRREVLREVYELFDALETSMNSDAARSAHAPSAASTTGGANRRVSIGLGSTNVTPFKQHVPFSGAQSTAAPVASGEVKLRSATVCLLSDFGLLNFVRRTTF